jgi:hypothetical protein
MDECRVRFKHASGLPLLLWLAVAAGPAHTQIIECAPDPAAFTVFLSEPAFTSDAFASAEKMKAFLERLQFQLDQRTDARWIRSPATDVRFKLCPGRRPSPTDDSEFEPALVNNLYGRRVLLEIWGRLYVAPGPGGAATRSAQLNYLLIPIKQAHNQRERVPQALQRLLYPRENAKPASDYVALIAQPQDIDAFIAAALGYKLLREKAYDLAHRNLCRASVLLRQTELRQPAGRAQQDVAALRAFVLTSAEAAVARLPAAALHVAGEPCGEER